MYSSALGSVKNGRENDNERTGLTASGSNREMSSCQWEHSWVQWQRQDGGRVDSYLDAPESPGSRRRQHGSLQTILGTKGLDSH